MSSSDRRTFLGLLAALPLAGCGFAPVYAPGGPGLALRNRVLVEPPLDRLEFALVARLEERLGRAGTPGFVLTHETSVTERGIAVTGANDITRYTLTGEVDFVVTEAGSDVQVYADSVSTFTAYSTTGSTVATAASERDAEERLMVALADRIVSRLLSSAARWA